MKTALMIASIVALVAAAAWALAGSEPSATPCAVEVRDVAGVQAFTVVPEVVARANAMPEVVARTQARPEVAGSPAANSEVPN